MHNSLFFQISLLLIGAALLFTGCSGSDSPQQQADSQQERELTYETTVEFISANGESISEIEVAIADDDASRSEGLMDVNNLPEDAGMLFIFEDNEPRSFWMASTPLSLDIIFVNEDYEIVRIHRNTPPFSQESLESEYPTKYVVEVNAGYTVRNDITEGASIRVGEW